MRTKIKYPFSIALAAFVIVLFLSLFVLEITDSIVFHHRLARSAFFFPPAAVLLWGVLARRRWAWFAARAVTFVGALIFTATGVVAILNTHMKPRDQHGILTISFLLGAILAATFTVLGRPAARNLYQPGEQHEH
jgi:hypothetical protein